MSGHGREYRNLELTYDPVNANRISEDDRNTYIAGMRDLIDLDAVLIVSSGNRNVSP